MKLNLQLESDRVKAREYLERLSDGQKPIELKEIRPKRSNRQNGYLHAIITEWACEVGYTLLEAKCCIKAAMGYTYQKGGTTIYRETSKMDTKELSEFTEKFRNLAATQEIYLMSPDEFERGGWVEVQKRKEQMKAYL